MARSKIVGERRETAWVGIRTLADLLDLSVEHTRRSVLRRVPADAVRRRKGRIEVYAIVALTAYLRPSIARDLEREWALRGERIKREAEDDALNILKFGGL
jgi:hypothetical protein